VIRACWLAALAALAALLLSGCGMYGSLYLEEPPAERPAPVEPPPPLPVDETDEDDPDVTPRRADQADPAEGS
jgi:predicted small lipoprotein YifL